MKSFATTNQLGPGESKKRNKSLWGEKKKKHRVPQAESKASLGPEKPGLILMSPLISSMALSKLCKLRFGFLETMISNS